MATGFFYELFTPKPRVINVYPLVSKNVEIKPIPR